MKSAARVPGVGAIELVEEAVHLLRGAPAGLFGAYAVGTLPFVLAFLYYWADMSSGAFAREHVATGALAMGLLFLWMKCWQAVFAAGLRARITGADSPSWNFRRARRLALTQIALQPSGLFVVPLAFVIMLPFGWVYNFYQNVTASGGEGGTLGETFQSAATQASYRQGQNHLLLAILAAFAFFVLINVAVAVATLPGLLKTLLGIDSAFTQAGAGSVFNTTYLASSVALAWICADPLVKAVYVLRCFYGQSLQTGEDLKAELARVSAAPASMALLAVLIYACAQLPASAGPPQSAVVTNPPTTAVSPAELDQSINQVLQQPQFAWRMPRVEKDDSDSQPKSWLARMVGAVVNTIKDVTSSAVQALGNLFKWIVDKLFPDHKSSPTSGFGSGWIYSLQYLLVILIIAIAATLGVLIIRTWSRRRKADVVVAEAVQARPDLNDENVAADQLPEEGWLKLAAEMLQQGNLRLALRAYYLAGLAHLAARELIAIALFKSNREYETELRRRARALPDVQSAFSQNVSAFDRAWYGLHEVTGESLREFQSNFERIRAC